MSCSKTTGGWNAWRRSPWGRWVLLGMLSGLAIGCRQETVRVYETPKETFVPVPEQASVPRPEEGGLGMPAMPVLKWSQLPEGWTERASASRMRAATFGITDSAGARAELAVVGIPGMRDDDFEFINMWREQVKLPPLEREQLAQHVEPVQIAGLQGKLFSIGTAVSGQNSTITNAIRVAVVVRDGVSWFFKMAGDVPLVTSQAQPFRTFLQGVRFEEPPAGSAPFAGGGGGAGAGAASGSSGSSGSAALPKWEVPKGWQEGGAGPMILARFIAPGENDAQADITISSFPGDVGGLLANVNRWRDQVKLPRLSESELGSVVKTVNLKEGQGTMVELTGTDSKTGKPAKLVGVVVPRQGQTWFFKMMGHPDVASKEVPAFLQFVQSADYAALP